jgi:translation initiation factor 2 beta subunit (eIF-2beta)/eIF-5
VSVADRGNVRLHYGADNKTDKNTDNFTDKCIDRYPSAGTTISIGIRQMSLEPTDMNDSLETGEHIVSYFCEETGTMITVTDSGDTVIHTQETPEEVLAGYPKHELMTFAEASRAYLAWKVRKKH